MPRYKPVTVSLKGKPLEKALVIFVPKGSVGQASFGTTDAEGKYDLMTYEPQDGAVPGEYSVKVSKYEETAVTDTRVFKDSEEEQAYYQENPKAALPPKNLLPQKYASEASSGLAHTVGDTATVFDIDLK